MRKLVWNGGKMQNGKGDKGILRFVLSVMLQRWTPVDVEKSPRKDVMKSHRNFENFKVSDAVGVCL